MIFVVLAGNALHDHELRSTDAPSSGSGFHGNGSPGTARTSVCSDASTISAEWPSGSVKNADMR